MAGPEDDLHGIAGADVALLHHSEIRPKTRGESRIGRSVKGVAATLGLSPKTVSTYRTRLMEKMGFATNADLVQYAAAHGLIEHEAQRRPSDRTA